MERREYKRLPAETEVRIQDVEASESEEASSVDMSGGGILLSTQKPYAVGSLLDIEVRSVVHKNFSHAFKPLQARVRVVRIKGQQAPYEIAAEFIQVK